MDNDKMMEMFMQLSKESAERDAKVETRLDEIDRRLSKFEAASEETRKTMEENSQNLGRIEDKLTNDDSRIKNLFEKSKGFKDQQALCDERFKALEDRPKNLIWKGFVKFASILFSLIATAVATYLITKAGLK